MDAAVLTHRVADATTGRRHELDWLRLGAVLLVFTAHLAQIFSPSEAWLIESQDRSRLLGLYTILLGPWLMPLFMLVAGASSWYALRSRTIAEFFRARVLRLVVPLFVGTFLVIPPQMYYRSLARGTFEGSYLAFYPRFFDGVYPDGNFSYGHLWFLVYLFLLMTAALPILGWLRGDPGRAWLRRAAGRCGGRFGILWLVVPMTVSQLVLRVPFTMTTGAVINDWATLAWFFLVFLYGFAIMAEPRLGEAIDQQWRRILWLALACTGGLMVWAWAGDIYARIPGRPSAWYFLWWNGFMLASWAWLVVILGAARRFLAAPTPGLRHWSEAAYPFYILHQPVIVAVAYHLVDQPMGLFTRWVAIGAAALVFTALLVEAVRRVPVARTLFGLPAPHATSPAG